MNVTESCKIETPAKFVGESLDTVSHLDLHVVCLPIMEGSLHEAWPDGQRQLKLLVITSRSKHDSSL